MGNAKAQTGNCRKARNQTRVSTGMGCPRRLRYNTTETATQSLRSRCVRILRGVGRLEEIPNGVALCSLRHELFDRGMITLTDDYRVLMSEHSTGSAMFQHMVMDLHGRELSMPIRTEYNSSLTFVARHVRVVVREPARGIQSG